MFTLSSPLPRSHFTYPAQSQMEPTVAAACPPQPPHSEPMPLPQEVADLLLCPISRCIMRDPVLTCDGHSYERASIEAWLARGHRTSPMTGLVLPSRKLWPNLALKHLGHALRPRSAEEEEEEEKEKARQGAAQREQGEEHDAAVASGTSSEDEDEEEEEDEDSSNESDSDEEADEARGVLRVMSVMPARYRPRQPASARRRAVGMVQAAST